MITLEELLETRINWENDNRQKSLLSTMIRGEKIYLRFNDFPEEPLCTVIFPGVRQDLDDCPEWWIIPKYRKG